MLAIAYTVATWLPPVVLGAVLLVIAAGLVRRTLDITKVTAGRGQLLVVTIVGAGAYWSLATATAPSGGLPDLPPALLTTVGLSQGVHLILKGFEART